MLFVFFNLPLGISGLQKNLSKRKNTQKEISDDKCDEKIPGTVADNFKTQTVETINACKSAIGKHYFYSF
ncbi:hypothetical protein DMH17_05870 [Raoultella planticola]|nr:hypothetical protein [Raoultella planticola]